MGSPVRVVFVTTVFDSVDTGPGVYARYLWEALRNDPAIEFHLVAPDAYERHERLHLSGIGRSSLDTYSRVQLLALDLVRQLGPGTIVHGNSAHSMWRFTAGRAPLIVQVNDYDVADALQNARHVLRERGPKRLASLLWRRWQESRVLRAASTVVCNSRYTSDRIARAYAMPFDKLVVIHKAVDTGAFVRPDNSEDGAVGDAGSRFRLVFIGSDWRRKGLDVLLRAVAQLVGNGVPVRLVVIGPSGQEDELAGLVADLGLKDIVSALGPVSRAEVARCLWESDLFILPSRREALGVAVLEAMAAGLPVVATSVGGIPEILTDARDGRLVPAGDVAALGSAIEDLLSNEPLRKQLAEAGKRRAQEFGVPAMVEKVRALYASLATQQQLPRDSSAARPDRPQ
jgi:glycosyltransferase involved in cell wall biosynthesis